MKTKLLKKVRRRFEIILYPKGFVMSGTLYYSNTGCVRLVDKTGKALDWSYQLCSYTIEEATNLCKDRILDYIRGEYPKKSKKNLPAIKLWYNG